MHKHERLAQLLAQGHHSKEATAIVGISEAYYNRLKDSPEFLDLLRVYAAPDRLEDPEAYSAAQARLADHTAYDEHELREDKWAALEARTLNAALAVVGTADLKDVNKTLDILARRRASNKHADAALLAAKNPGQQVLVTLNLPDYQREKILSDNVVVTNTNEVIRAGSRDLSALPTESVLDMLEASKEEYKQPITADDL